MYTNAPDAVTITIVSPNIAATVVLLLLDLLGDGESALDKEATSHDDLFDAFRLSLEFWH